MPTIGDVKKYLAERGIAVLEFAAPTPRSASTDCWSLPAVAR
jgi:hypothetical protein